jgi:hypothetical protein
VEEEQRKPWKRKGKWERERKTERWTPTRVSLRILLKQSVEENSEQFQTLIREYGDLFPKGLPALPPHRQVYHYDKNTTRWQHLPNRPAYRLSVLGVGGM